MNAKAQKKFRVNPAKEIVETILRLARAGIDPGETVDWMLRRRDVHYDGEVVTRLRRHDE
ncbi:MAG: hypothetical protein RXR82_06570 [Nitrososphaeria archaeon]|jgi:tRNA(Ser,Leu) C12 N-acetylase TAN1